MARRGSRLLLASIVLMTTVAVTGCSVSIPADPDGTLEKVRGGTLEVGISPSPPWTEVTGSSPSGVDVDLVEDFAESVDAEIVWREGGEESLIGALEQGELDLVIGGLTDASPWTAQAAITKPFAEATGEDGSTEKHVMAAPLGENAFLLELESFLLDQEVMAP